MPIKPARTKSASQPKYACKSNDPTKKRITRATSSRDRFWRIAADLEPTSDEAYLRDEAILAEALSEFSFDEQMAMDHYDIASIAISAGSPAFQAEALPLLCRALGKRTERLHKLLDDARVFLESRLQDYHPDLSQAERETAIAYAIASAKSHYGGEVNEEPVSAWVVDKVRQAVTFVRAIREDENACQAEFDELYKHRRALLGGIYSVLETCVDLGADLGQDGKVGDTVSEIEQVAWMYIWNHLSDWTSPDRAHAAITTRLYGLGRDTARIWRTARLRNRNRSEWIAYLLEHYGLSEKDAPDDEDELRQAA